MPQRDVIILTAVSILFAFPLEVYTLCICIYKLLWLVWAFSELSQQEEKSPAELHLDMGVVMVYDNVVDNGQNSIIRGWREGLAERD